MDMQVRVWTKDDILSLLETNDKAVIRAIKGLYARQTASERADKTTREANGQGFNAKDAPFLTDLASKMPIFGDRLTPRQTAAARRMLRKYWKQLLEMIEEKGGAVEFPGSRKKDLAKPMEREPQPVANWGMF